ncbi:MAG TPA: tetratricopeptide repeat protein [Thermoanaerobaculia bacterium]|nr:tetratricopeptide repeat protein [Thermoanaerobaculia bacterium]
MKIHPSDEVLEELSVFLDKDRRRIVQHLARCPVCMERFEALFLKLTQEKGASADLAARELNADDYGPLLDRMEAFAQRQGQLLEKERRAAPGLFLELLALPSQEWLSRIEDSEQFRTWGVLELLVERSLESAASDPVGAERLALAALRLADLLDINLYGEGVLQDIRARAWAHAGNARRVRSDLPGAEEAFAKALTHLEAGTGDLLEEAVHLDLRASLLRDRRRLGEAAHVLQKAISMFLDLGDRHRAGTGLVKMATVHHHSGNPEEGIASLYEALPLIDPEREPRLLLCARHNLIFYLASAGRYQEAQELYRSSRSLYRDFPDAWVQNRRKWVRGKISRGLGQPSVAESLFLAARQGFLAEGMSYDTALISLELATLYAEQGRTADLKVLAQEMLPIFTSLQIHREALAALAYLRQAMEAERVTVDLITMVANYLDRARHDPELRFQEPS